MLGGRREGWLEITIIVDGDAVETGLVHAIGLRELRAIRKRLIQQPSVKTQGSELADGDISLDFHRDEHGKNGGIEKYVLDPVAFSPAAALPVLPDIIDLPHDTLSQLINGQLSM